MGAALEHPIDCRWELRTQQGDRGRLSAGFGPSTGEGLVGQQRQAVDVGGGADRQAGQLLRRDVRDRTLGGQPDGIDVIGGDPEVAQEGVAVTVEQDVGGLQVTVKNTVAVGVVEGRPDLVEQAQRRRRSPR